MKVLFISTVAHNPGDEFIRLGQEYLLKQLFPAAKFTAIHKHDPRTLFEGFQQRSNLPHRRLISLLYRLYASFGRGRGANRLETADMVVFAGSPFIWRINSRLLPSTAANAEWVPATWQRLFSEYPDKPVLNLAAGSSAGTAQQLNLVLTDRKVVRFLKRAVSRCAVTTVRDKYAQEVLRELGLEVPLLPCTSILSAKGAGVAPQRPEFVALNIMQSAVHATRGQQTDGGRWLGTIREVVPEIEKRHKVVCISHSADEDQLAASLFPGRERFVSKNPHALLEVYSRSLFGICNRVHSAAAIAAFGRPVILVGGDTRINVLEQFGMPALDHREIGARELLRATRDVESHYARYVQILGERSAFTTREHLGRIRLGLRLDGDQTSADLEGKKTIPHPVLEASSATRS